MCPEGPEQDLPHDRSSKYLWEDDTWQIRRPVSGPADRSGQEAAVLSSLWSSVLRGNSYKHAFPRLATDPPHLRLQGWASCLDHKRIPLMSQLDNKDMGPLVFKGSPLEPQCLGEEPRKWGWRWSEWSRPWAACLGFS